MRVRNCPTFQALHRALLQIAALQLPVRDEGLQRILWPDVGHVAEEAGGIASTNARNVHARFDQAKAPIVSEQPRETCVANQTHLPVFML